MKRATRINQNSSRTTEKQAISFIFTTIAAINQPLSER